MKHDHSMARFGLHLGFEIARLAVKAAGVCAAFLMVKEIHQVHKKIEERKR